MLHPPNYDRRRGEAALSYIVDTIVDLKIRFYDPQLIIAGDFNQWKIDESLLDFNDIKEVAVGST